MIEYSDFKCYYKITDSYQYQMLSVYQAKKISNSLIVILKIKQIHFKYFKEEKWDSTTYFMKAVETLDSRNMKLKETNITFPSLRIISWEPLRIYMFK